MQPHAYVAAIHDLVHTDVVSPDEAVLAVTPEQVQACLTPTVVPTASGLLGVGLGVSPHGISRTVSVRTSYWRSPGTSDSSAVASTVGSCGWGTCRAVTSRLETQWNNETISQLEAQLLKPRPTPNTDMANLHAM